MEKKTKIILSILLAILPIISFILYYCYSVQTGTLENLKNVYALYYLDFLFIIFNALILYSIKINKKILLTSLIGCTAILSAMNFLYWTFTFEVGLVHLIFAIIEMSLLLTALFSKIENKKLYLIMMIPIMIYFILAFIVEMFIREPRVIWEAIPHLIGLIVVGIKVFRPKWFYI